MRATIHALWFARKAVLESGDSVLAQARAEELRAYMQQEGIAADREVARGFAYEGYEHLRLGNFERAREAFDQARLFDPYLPQAQIGYAWSLLRAGRGMVAFVQEYRRGLFLSWQELTADDLQLSNLAVMAALALFASLTMFSLVVVARCQGRLRHDLYEIMRKALPERGARFTSWGIVLLPLLAWVGGIWLVLFWLALSFRYMRLPEKAAAACVFLMLALSPLGVSLILDRFQGSTDPDIRVAVEVLRGGYSPATLRRLEQVVGAHGEEAELHLLLGACYARGERLGDAYDTFRRVLQLNPASARAYLDLGNVYFRLGEHAQAVAQYKQAAQIQPDMISSYWNLYLAQTELLHFAEAEENLARVRALDGGLAGDLLARKKGTTGPGLLLEENADLGLIKRGLRSDAGVEAAVSQSLGGTLTLASGAGLLVALLLTASGRERLAEACGRCGRSHCRRCQIDSGQSGWCARCVHLLLKTDGTSAEVRAEGLVRLERSERLRRGVRRLVSLALPGAGHILAGRIGLGLSLLVAWVSAGTFLIVRDRLLMPARVPVIDFPPAGVIAAGVVMGVIWIAGNAAPVARPQTMGALRHGA